MGLRCPVLHRGQHSTLRISCLVVRISDDGEARCCPVWGFRGSQTPRAPVTGFPCLGLRLQVYLCSRQPHSRSVPGSSGRLLLAVSATGPPWRCSPLGVWMMKSLLALLLLDSFLALIRRSASVNFLAAKCRKCGNGPMGRWMLQCRSGSVAQLWLLGRAWHAGRQGGGTRWAGWAWAPQLRCVTELCHDMGPD